ncbi:MAG: histidine--tRNA ligase [Patescibacteria group bacterium]|nr:histidine--tRNA ligase [Patescibacteria group bacterium]
MNKKQNISKEPYKGTRDFYPEDLAVQNFIFDKAGQITEKFGYEEYNTSVLEPTELYKAKSGEEIINEQTYSFMDRGERDVTLRPEMTPSIARMVAKRKRELAYPLRWYSIQNFFRYERPQKGRLREFWQLNADIFGVEGIEAEVEIISLGYEIMKSLGAKDEDFEIKINYSGMLAKVLREILNEEDEEKINKTIKVIDRFGKIPEEEFNKRLDDALGGEKSQILKNKLDDKDSIKELFEKDPNLQICKDLKNKLETIGIQAKIDVYLIRGFDYYTGIVFEFFDTNPDNNRSLFGGGRYDKLLDIFGEEKMPAVGFGMGDVTIKDFLESRNLLPQYQSKTDLYLCTLSSDYFENANQLADNLRKQGLNIAVNYSNKKIGDQIAIADKKRIPFVICIGENEVKNNKYQLKNLQTGEEQEVDGQEVVKEVRPQ